MKILVINPFGIGDVLFTTPILKAIKKSQPDTLISYWCNQRVGEILSNNPHLDKIFPLSRGDLKKIWRISKIDGIKRFLGLFHTLKKEKFDMAIDFSLDHRYSLMTKILGVKKRIGFNYKNRGLFLTDKIDIDGYSHRHMVESYLDLLKFIQIEPADRALELFIPEVDKVYAQNMFIEAGIKADDLIIGIAPGGGASWGKDASLKQWPAAKFAQLIDKLVDNLGAKVIVFGDDSEKPIVDIIHCSAKSKFFDLVGKTDLKQLAAIISGLKILVANDGGPMHMAVATGINSVAVFGPVDDLVYGPYPQSAKHIVVKNNIGCSPCYRNFRLALCQKNRECINAIEVEEVFSAVRRLV